jgi:hypothetical protein
MLHPFLFFAFVFRHQITGVCKRSAISAIPQFPATQHQTTGFH